MVEIENQGYEACWRGMPREGNEEIPLFHLRQLGYQKALAYTRDGASSGWYRSRIDAWFWGWDKASRERALETAAADIRLLELSEASA